MLLLLRARRTRSECQTSVFAPAKLDDDRDMQSINIHVVLRQRLQTAKKRAAKARVPVLQELITKVTEAECAKGTSSLLHQHSPE